ncbi:Bcr/CflA family drug resistance efflux transporter [Capsulimonas corticalis]|uniref:Bcr/CflA family drug resistance efflux transporter n=1 Tax=Capsulimonas corticalis TaxID=2219043 RepID=A0A402CTU5_9BACT|nr:multidrug effflux MFS transporter [Capsulimonas corticalis]BDI30626.1 Bcr/CflA family drug resistance efflux transporter [Capsulimonas corticalis]
MTVSGAHPSTLLLGALTAMTALSIDMSLPALPQLRHLFHAGAAQAQLTLTLFLVGYAISQIFCGPLSDARGRKPVLLWGILLFTLGGIGCALSPSLPILIAFRFLQGLGAGVGPVLSRALVRDTYDRTEATVVFSHITQVMIVAPIIAPTIGGALLTHVGWPAIFVLLAIAGAALWFAVKRGIQEPDHAGLTVLTPAELLARYKLFLGNPTCVANMLIFCFAYAGLFAYVAGSPFVLMEVFGIPKAQFGVYFAITAVALLCGATLNKTLVRRQYSHAALLRLGVATVTASGALLFAASWLHWGGVAWVIVPMMGYLFGIGVTSPHAMAAAMEPYPQMAGVTSSLIGSLQTAGGGLAGALVAAFYTHTTQSLGVVVLTAVAGMLLSFAWTVTHARKSIEAVA